MHAPVKILAHRGIWSAKSEQNTLEALVAPIRRGLGVETDLRDCRGELMISHDPARGDELHFQEFLEAINSVTDRAVLALNIKADGLQKLVQEALKDTHHDYFLFDMSVPDQRVSLKQGLKCFSRLSDVEKDPVFVSQVAGFWVDNMIQERWSHSDLVKMGRTYPHHRLMFVSPELHKLPHEAFWNDLRQALREGVFESEVGLCTDLVGPAEEFFK